MSDKDLILPEEDAALAIAQALGLEDKRINKLTIDFDANVDDFVYVTAKMYLEEGQANKLVETLKHYKLIPTQDN